MADGDGYDDGGYAAYAQHAAHAGPRRHSTGARSGSLTPDSSMMSFRNMEAILLTAQQQQLRHVKRLHQMRRQAEMSAAMQAAWEEKQQEERQRLAAREAELKRAQAQRLAHSKEVKARNAAAQQAAATMQEMYREALSSKLEAAKQRAEDIVRQRSLLAEFARVQSARIEARRRRTHANHERALEERRAALLEKEALEQKHRQQQEELRLIQQAIRREEDALAAVRREEAKRRAEAEAEEKSAYYGIKAAQRSQQLAERKGDLAALRAARAEEARQRAAYIQQRVAEATYNEESRRERLAARLQEKMSRVDAIMAQREALVREVRQVQLSMASQEERLRAALEEMERTGKWKLPAELLNGATSEPAAGGALGQLLRCQWPRPGSGAASESDYEPARLGRAGSLRQQPPSGPLGARAASRQEAELQRVLEEEILREMEREQALAQEPDHNERKRMLRSFAAEREPAKARILSVGTPGPDDEPACE